MPFDELVPGRKVEAPKPRQAEGLRHSKPPKGKKLSKGSKSATLNGTVIFMQFLKIILALVVMAIIIGAAWWGYQLYIGE